MFSKRINKIRESESMRMNEVVNMLRRQGKEIINLSIGEPDFNTPQIIKKRAMQAITENKTHYTNSQGILELRTEIVKKYIKQVPDIKITEENILITPGGKQGIYYVLSTILNEGDQVIIFDPSWLTYQDAVKLCGGHPVFIACSEKNKFHPDLFKINKVINKRTKLIIINNPNNPTGAVYNKEFIYSLIKTAMKYNVYILFDEIYNELVFDQICTTSINFFNEYDKIIVLNGFSKALAMTGFRIAYLIGNYELIKNCNKMQQQTATCVSSIAQYAALELNNCDDEIKKMKNIYKERRDIVYKEISSIQKLNLVKPQGGFYAFINIKETGMESIEFVLWILENAQVALTMGTAYGPSGEGFVRLSFAAPKAVLIKAISKIKIAIGELK